MAAKALILEGDAHVRSTLLRTPGTASPEVRPSSKEPPGDHTIPSHRCASVTLGQAGTASRAAQAGEALVDAFLGAVAAARRHAGPAARGADPSPLTPGGHITVVQRLRRQGGWRSGQDGRHQRQGRHQGNPRGRYEVHHAHTHRAGQEPPGAAVAVQEGGDHRVPEQQRKPLGDAAGAVPSAAVHRRLDPLERPPGGPDPGPGGSAPSGVPEPRSSKPSGRPPASRTSPATRGSSRRSARSSTSSAAPSAMRSQGPRDPVG